VFFESWTKASVLSQIYLSVNRRILVPIIESVKRFKLSKSEKAFHTSGVASKASLADEASNLSKILSQIENLIALFRKGTKGVLEEIKAVFARLVKCLE